MDKIKQQLAVVLQYGFWIGCVVVLFGSLAVWWMSTSRLEDENARQVSAIKTDVDKVKMLRGEINEQPNDKSHEKMNEMIKARTDEVLKAWQEIYQDQLGILTWPEDEWNKNYIDEFRFVRDEETGQLDRKRRKLPFERFVDNVPEDEVAPTIRVSYARYIGDVLEDIAAIANAEWTSKFENVNAGGGMGMEMEMDSGMGMDMMGMEGPGTRREVNIAGMEKGPLVKWSSASQESVLSDLFPWRGNRPSTLQVYYSQENLWILKQLLQIVADVNGNARLPFEAKIREIQQLRIGQSVKLDGIGNIASPGQANSAMGGMGMGMGMGMDDMGDMGMGMGGDYDMDTGTGMDSLAGGGFGGTAEIPDPGDNRYVDTENEPIVATDLRTRLTSNQPADAPIAVAKRIPVMMSLKIDQRYVPELIAACGSAPLMVEVKQARILPKNATAGGGMGMDMGMDSGMGGMEMGMDSGMGGMDMGMGMGGGAAGKTDEFPLDVTVEVYGLIHLYNPPNEEALGIEEVTQETPVTDNGALPAPAATAAPDPSATTPPAVDPAATPPAGTPPATGQPPAGTAPAPAAIDPAAPTGSAPTAAAPAGPTAIATPN